MKKRNIIFELLKGVLFATAITVIGVAALALFAKDTASDFISIISVVIKIISIVIGTVASSLKIRKRGAVIGMTVSCLYWMVCTLLSLLLSPIIFSFKLLLDFLFTVLIGAFSGILTVNTLK